MIHDEDCQALRDIFQDDGCCCRQEKSPTPAELATLRGIREGRLVVVEGWQPIETAPKDDGRDGLLVWHAPHVELAVRRAGEWYVANYPDGAILSPTHWMPLPAPPAAKEEGNG